MDTVEKDDLVAMGSFMSTKLTDTRKKGLKELILPAFESAQAITIDGSKGKCEEDYCAGEGQGERRGRMTCLNYNLSFQNLIQQQLPENLFPCGFVRTLLINAPSYIKRSCDIPMMEGFFDNVHDEESKVVKRIKTEKKDFVVGEKTIIIERQEEIESLNYLLV